VSYALYMTHQLFPIFYIIQETTALRVSSGTFGGFSSMSRDHLKSIICYLAYM